MPRQHDDDQERRRGRRGRSEREKVKRHTVPRSDDTYVMPVKAKEAYGQPAFGGGYPSAVGGNARKNESPPSTLRREMGQELPEYRLTGVEQPAAYVDREGSTRYEYYRTTAEPRQTPGTPSSGNSDPRAHDEMDNRRVEMRTSELSPGMTRKQVLDLAALRAGPGKVDAPWNRPTGSDLEQRQQYYGSHTMNNFAQDMLNALPAPTAPAPAPTYSNPAAQYAPTSYGQQPSSSASAGGPRYMSATDAQRLYQQQGRGGGSQQQRRGNSQ